MKVVRLPLGVLFAFASVIIAGGFAAVILLLTVSQREAYTESIYEQIELAQRKANLTIIEPLLRWEPSLDTLALKMKSFPGGYVVNKSAMPIDLIPFWNDAMPMLKEPRINRVFQLVLANATDMVAAMAVRTLGLELVGLAIDLTAYGSIILSYPVTAAQVQYPLTSYINIREDPAYNSFSMPNRSYWVPSVTFDYFENKTAFEFLYGAPILFDQSGATIGAVFIGVFMNELIQIVTDARATPATTSLLFDFQADRYLGSSDPSLPTFDLATRKHYTMANVPSQWVKDIFSTVVTQCPPSTCEYSRFNHNDDIVSSLSMRTSQNRMNFLLLQVTPRSHFFRDWDRNLAVGVAVGVIAAVVVLSACVILWLIIWRNIKTLQESMQLASEMRNHEAHIRSSHSPSSLAEIGAIQTAFEAMNHRLLLARPFLPQALLVANVSASDIAAGGSDSEMEEAFPSAAVELDGMQDVPSTASDIVSPAEQRPSSVAGSAHGAPHVRSSMGMGLVRLDAMTSRSVAILSINVRNFHELVRKIGPEAVQRVHGSLSDIVEQRANAERGIVDSLHGDRFLVTFNVARALSRAAQAAANAALGIVEDLEAQQVLGQRHPLSMGLASGRALVGNMGTDTIKKLCTIGAVYPESVALERVARWVGTPCVMSDRAKIEADHCAQSFMLGYVRLQRKQQQQTAVQTSETEVTTDTKEESDSQKKSVPTMPLPQQVTNTSFHPNLITVNRKMSVLSNNGDSQPIPILDSNNTFNNNSSNSNLNNTSGGSGGVAAGALSSVGGVAVPMGSKSEKRNDGFNNLREVFALMQRMDIINSEEWLYALKNFKDSNPFRELEATIRNSVMPRGGKKTSINLGQGRPPSGPGSNANPNPTAQLPPQSQITRTVSSTDARQDIIPTRPSTGVSATGSNSSEMPEQDPTALKALAPRSVEWVERRVKDVLVHGEAPVYDVSR